MALYSGLPVLDAFGLNHAEIASLPKPEGFRNEWGVYRLDVLLKSDPPVIYLDLPQFYDWTFDQVAAGEVSCDGLGKERILDLVANFEEPLAEGFQCISLPSKSQPGLWQNILVAKERPEVLSSAPAGTLRSDCLADLMKACRAENIGTKN